MAIEIMVRVSDENEPEFREMMQRTGAETPLDLLNKSYCITRKVIARASEQPKDDTNTKLRGVAGKRMDENPLIEELIGSP